MNHVSPPDPLEWGDALRLGYGPMDLVHEEFVYIVTAMGSCEDGQLLQHIDRFLAHAQAHFGGENAWMASTGFPAYECHLAEHEAVLESAHQVRELVEAGEWGVGRSFAAELMAWFPGHADYMDAALAHWMCKRAYGGKPVVLRRRAGAGSGDAPHQVSTQAV